MRISSPIRSTSRRSSVRIGLLAWHSAARNVVKSCRPISSLRGFVHDLGIERPGDVPDPARIERRRRPAVEDAIDVVPLHGGDARIERLGHDLRREDRDGGRLQMRVGGVPHRIRPPLLVQIHMHDLMGGVNAGIRAAGAMDPHGLCRRSARWHPPPPAARRDRWSDAANR